MRRKQQHKNTGNLSVSNVNGRMTMVVAQVDKFVIQPKRLQFQFLGSGAGVDAGAWIAPLSAVWAVPQWAVDMLLSRTFGLPFRRPALSGHFVLLVFLRLIQRFQRPAINAGSQFNPFIFWFTNENRNCHSSITHGLRPLCEWRTNPIWHLRLESCNYYLRWPYQLAKGWLRNRFWKAGEKYKIFMGACTYSIDPEIDPSYTCQLLKLHNFKAFSEECIHMYVVVFAHYTKGSLPLTTLIFAQFSSENKTTNRWYGTPLTITPMPTECFRGNHNFTLQKQ